jgi:hypothetical protein
MACGALARPAWLEQPRRSCSRPCASHRTSSWARWIVAMRDLIVLNCELVRIQHVCIANTFDPVLIVVTS